MAAPRSPRDQVFHVRESEIGQLLTHQLRVWMPGSSWTVVRKLIDSRRIKIDGNLCLDATRRLQSREVVKVLEHPAAIPPREVDVRVRYLDAHLVVVEKPAGMTTLRHPLERSWSHQRKQLQPTLDELLPKIVDRLSAGGRSQKGVPRRLRPVHRLDRETSGLMVFARTIPAESALGKQFRAHSLGRTYIAVVHGRLEQQTFTSHLVEDRGDGRRGSTRHPNQGKHAVTHVKPLEFLEGYTIAECQLETGRTHQIRIHFAEAGHPLCGDRVYRGPFPGVPLPDQSGAPRVALHAAELSFTHPVSGARLRFQMPLPDDLIALTRRLRGGPPAEGAAPWEDRTGADQIEITEPAEMEAADDAFVRRGRAAKSEQEEFDQETEEPRSRTAGPGEQRRPAGPRSRADGQRANGPGRRAAGKVPAKKSAAGGRSAQSRQSGQTQRTEAPRRSDRSGKASGQAGRTQSNKSGQSRSGQSKGTGKGKGRRQRGQ